MDDHKTGFTPGARSGDKPTLYADLASEIDGLLAGETDAVANLANAAAAIYHGLPQLNWGRILPAAEFRTGSGTVSRQSSLVRIPVGQGVCGTAARTRKSVLVPDVHEFPGHIACDATSRSELVVPLLREQTLIGVLDLDSPLPARFDARDQAGCEVPVAIILRHLGPIPAA